MMLARAAVLALAVPAAAIPQGWDDPEITPPSINECLLTPGATQASIYSQLDVPESVPNRVVEWIKPNCAIGGSQIRVDAVLTEFNSGEAGVGFGAAGCTSGVDLINELNNTWLLSWYFLYPGTYSICHRPTGATTWTEQTKMRVLAPTPRQCSLVRSSETPEDEPGYVTCEFPPHANGSHQVMEFFDGFLNDKCTPDCAPDCCTRKPNKCTPDCATCLAQGGTCRCTESNAQNPTCSRCTACNENDRQAGLCDCGAPATPVARRLQRKRADRKAARNGTEVSSFQEALDLTFDVAEYWARTAAEKVCTWTSCGNETVA